MILSKTLIPNMPQFFDRYIIPVKEDNLMAALENSLNEFFATDWQHIQKIGDKTYLPNKWTIKTILQHINDNERIQTYRALRFARYDKSQLVGYDEDLLAQNSFAEKRSLEDIQEEFILLRKSSINFFRSLNIEALIQQTPYEDTQLCALALGFVLVGHQRHHFNIIKERYWNLIA